MCLIEHIPEAEPVPSQTSKIESFVTIVNAWKLITIVARLSILDLCCGSGYAFVYPFLLYMDPWTWMKTLQQKYLEKKNFEKFLN